MLQTCINYQSSKPKKMKRISFLFVAVALMAFVSLNSCKSSPEAAAEETVVEEVVEEAEVVEEVVADSTAAEEAEAPVEEAAE